MALMVMIDCPTTGEPLPTGIAVGNRESFESSDFRDNTVGPCPHCGGYHTWSKEDAYLSEE